MRILYSLAVGIGLSSTAFAQSWQPPNLPQAPQPASFPRYDNFPMPSTNGQVKMGATADDVLRQAGLPGQSGNNPALNQEANYRRIMQETQQNPYLERQKQLQEIEREVAESFPAKKQQPRIDFGYYKSKAFADTSRPFTDALARLKSMLAGRSPLSVKDAYFAVENAYGNPYLNKAEYDNILKQSVEFIKAWLTQNGYDLKDNMALHLGIQKFMSEKLTISQKQTGKDGKQTIKAISHLPLFYDYIDFKGEKDFRNYFLTKCLATGGGQCNSMPAVYLCLAEGLGAKAYLTFAPVHSFIKYPDAQGYIQNYEPTSNWNITDRWYADNLFISAQAIRSGIYLDTLNARQIVANAMIDLAIGYTNKYGLGNEDFVKDCISSSVPYFPRQNNLPSLFLYSSYVRSLLAKCMYEEGLKGLDDVNKSPKASMLYKEFLNNENYIKKLGYQDLPSNIYEEMMKKSEFRGKKQEQHQITGKQKRNLFIQTSK